VKVAKLFYCLVSRFGLVAAFTIRSINDSDNNIVSIKLELSGILFLPRGHYSGFSSRFFDGRYLIKDAN